MSAAGSLELVAVELAKLLAPLEQELAPERAKGFFQQVGITLSDAQVVAMAGQLNLTANRTAALQPIITQLLDAIAAGDVPSLVARGGDALNALANAINSLPTIGASVSGAAGIGASQVTKRIFDHLAFRYLGPTRGSTDILEILGLLEREEHNEDSTDPDAPPFTLATFRLDRLSGWFSKPLDQLKTLYDWGGGFTGSALFATIERIVARAGMPVIYDDTGAAPRLDLVLLEATPKLDVTPHGLVIRLKSATPPGTQTLQLGPDAKLDVKADVQPPFNTSIVLLPDGTVSLRPPSPGPSFQGDFLLKLTAQRTAPPQPFLLFGAAGGSRLELGALLVTTGARVAWSGSSASGAFLLEAHASKLKVVVDMTKGDGFLAQIAPGPKIEADVDVQLGISREHGFYFSGSSALEVQLPVHLTIGSIAVDALTIAAIPQASKIPVNIGADIHAALGPLVAVVQNLGVTATFAFVPSNSGNLGPLQFDLGFLPPKGVGLSLDAGVVTGGGFLYFDPDHGEYAGALELVFSDFLSLHAIGLITTKMPDGSSGFSLLIIVTADFGTGIQLGFGFTLLAVGGLLGLNRVMLLQPLMDGVRTGAIDDIMFPQDVVANAPRIISDLRVIFPPQEGIFLIGPMAKLGWGEPTLISLALGVIIEIPGDIAILGVLKLALPTDDLALLVIQVNFAGAIEFSKARLYFFASLFDSRVLFITIEGEMGVLFGYGDNANFVVSVGGFHPQYNPPPLPFPSPRRIEVDIINESYARIRCGGYFAVTSDSVQFGSFAEFFFGFDALNVQGHASFDALLQFSPFYFIVAISTSFSVSVFGVGVFSVDIDLGLQGPAPWHAAGTASISVFLFSIDIGIDVTWGDSRDTTLPPIKVMPILAGELGKQSNWRAVLPSGSNLSVSLRQLDPSETDFVLHPVGTLHISQRAIPLDLTLDKVGNQKPSDAKRFALAVTSAGLAQSATLHELFAPAQFKNYDDAAKLSLQAYSPQDSGLVLSAAGTSLASGTAITRIVRYDLTVIDTRFLRAFKRFFVLAQALFAHFLRGASVTRCSLSAYRAAQMQPFAQKVTVAPETFAVALQSTNRVYRAEAAAFTSQASAQDYLDRALAQDPTLTGTLHVLPQFEVAA
jgi:hypothetical protein